jgi:glycosyltransferase involved in cell wall biosynthesis
MNDKDGCKKPTFSIIIPTYNRALKLKRCLETIEKQSFQDFEVLVCDDGSKDNTAEIVRQFGEKGMRIRYFYNDNWGGPASPRNVGIANATASWLCFLDSDDSWMPDKLEECRQYLDTADFIYHDFNRISNGVPNGQITCRQLKKDAFIDLMINGNAIITSSACIKKELLEQVNGFTEDKRMIAVEDYDLWLKLSYYQPDIRFKYIPKVLGDYFIEDDNITAGDMRQIDRLNYIYELHAPQLNDKWRKKAGRMVSYLSAKQYHGMKDYKAACRHYQQSLFAARPDIRAKSVYFLMKALLRVKI